MNPKKVYAKDFTSGELMATATAREIRDGEVVFIGIGLPMLGALLAKNNNAPNAIIGFEAGILGGKPVGALWAVGDTGAARKAEYMTTMWWVFSDLQRGYMTLGILGGAQIDKFGNLNTTAILGDNVYPNVKARLPGSGGANDIASSAGRTVIMMRLEKKRFLNKIDYITSPGHLTGGNSRQDAGLVGGGPSAVITEKCIFRFNEEKEMYLDSLHPGVTVQEIKDNISWDLKVGKDLKETERPTVEQVSLVRAIDPTDIILRTQRLYEKMDFWEWAVVSERGWDKLINKTLEI
jgi:glutaconate CoA-transferase subunit B